jgi:hypothetical protein
MFGRYDEVSTLLYSENTFNFDRPKTFLLFASQIHCVSLNNIKSLTFDLPILTNNMYISNAAMQRKSMPSILEDETLRRQWQQIWDVIADMDGLIQVRVRFLGRSHHHIGKAEVELLRPLSSVRRKLPVFEVEVPWEGEEGNVEGELAIQQVPFTLKRVGIKGMAPQSLET